MPTVKLSSKNQVVLPKEVRQALGLKANDRLRIEATAQGTAVIEPLKADSVNRLYGMWRGTYPRPEQYIKQLRNEWRRRERGLKANG